MICQEPIQLSTCSNLGASLKQGSPIDFIWQCLIHFCSICLRLLGCRRWSNAVLSWVIIKLVEQTGFGVPDTWNCNKMRDARRATAKVVWASRMLEIIMGQFRSIGHLVDWVLAHFTHQLEGAHLTLHDLCLFWLGTDHSCYKVMVMGPTYKTCSEYLRP